MCTSFKGIHSLGPNPFVIAKFGGIKSEQKRNHNAKLVD